MNSHAVSSSTIILSTTCPVYVYVDLEQEKVTKVRYAYDEVGNLSYAGELVAYKPSPDEIARAINIGHLTDWPAAER